MPATKSMSSITSLYGLFSNLDILGINSIHYGPHRVNHGGLFQEDINYGEIHFILQLARNSGLLKHRPENLVPRFFHGAREPLEVPASGRWEDTRPVRSEASEAILAAARGLRPTIPFGFCQSDHARTWPVRFFKHGKKGWT